MVDASRRKAALATRLGARAHRLDRLVAADLIVRWFAAASGAEAADAARAYAGRADATLRRYRHERHRLYAGEGRWADRPFWQRRL